MKIAIVGGGIIGLCSAWYLHKKGHEVTVIDKGNITDGASFGNAGYISPSHFVPLAAPGMVAKGVKWMMSSSSPFYIKPRLNADLLRWGYMFWKNSNVRKMQFHIPHLYNLLQLSRDLSSAMAAEMGNDFRMEEKGIFMLYKTGAIEKHEIELAREARHLGIDTEVLSGKQVQEMEPNVEVDVRGGVLYPGDCHIHPGLFMQSLHRHLAKAGVQFRLGQTVSSFETNAQTISHVNLGNESIPCDSLVLAAGAWLPQLTAKLGIRLLLQAGKGYSMTFNEVSQNLQYPAILVDSRVAMTPWGNDLRMGGTMEINDLDSKPLHQRPKAIYNAALKYYPNLPVNYPSPEKIWSGFRPLSPDGLPYIGRHSRYQNLLIAGGHAMLGVSLCAATGKLIQQIADRETTSLPVHVFSPERFGK